MIFKQIKVGKDNFAYLIADANSGQAIIIDPSFEPDKIIQIAEQEELLIKYLINTHGHFDHTEGNEYILKHTAAKLLAPKDCDEIKLGDINLKIIATPGHSEDSICILTKKANGEASKLITGDTLFVGRVGLVWSEQGAKDEYASLQKLMQLPDNTEVYPGHDYGKTSSSTIGDEKKNNPYLRCKNFEKFWRLRCG